MEGRDGKDLSVSESPPPAKKRTAPPSPENKKNAEGGESASLSRGRDGKDSPDAKPRATKCPESIPASGNTEAGKDLDAAVSPAPTKRHPASPSPANMAKAEDRIMVSTTLSRVRNDKDLPAEKPSPPSNKKIMALPPSPGNTESERQDDKDLAAAKSSPPTKKRPASPSPENKATAENKAIGSVGLSRGQDGKNLPAAKTPPPTKKRPASAPSPGNTELRVRENKNIAVTEFPLPKKKRLASPASENDAEAENKGTVSTGLSQGRDGEELPASKIPPTTKLPASTPSPANTEAKGRDGKNIVASESPLPTDNRPSSPPTENNKEAEEGRSTGLSQGQEDKDTPAAKSSPSTKKRPESTPSPGNTETDSRDGGDLPAAVFPPPSEKCPASPSAENNTEVENKATDSTSLSRSRDGKDVAATNPLPPGKELPAPLEQLLETVAGRSSIPSPGNNTKTKDRDGKTHPAAKSPPPTKKQPASASTGNKTKAGGKHALPASTSTKNTPHTRNGRKGLPYHVQRSIAIDIERAGGIQHFSRDDTMALKKLCDKNPHLYGSRGDDIRRMITNKVNKWKSFTEAEYNTRVICRLEVEVGSNDDYEDAGTVVEDLDNAVVIGIFGGGTVAGGIATILESKKDAIRSLTGGKFIKIKKICVQDLRKERDFAIPAGCVLVSSHDQILNDPQISVVVEVMGGTIDAKDVVFKAIKKKKKVVTANAALIAANLPELENLLAAKGSDAPEFRYEAAVCGGIPIVRSMLSDYPGDDISMLSGVLNSCTNFILTVMDQKGVSYEEALLKAYELGYAKADPTLALDVGGFDTRSKLRILIRLAFGIHVNEEDIPCEGITDLTKTDFEYAKMMGGTIKLVGVAKVVENEAKVAACVSPCFVASDDPLSTVRDATNAVEVNSNNLRSLRYIGEAAGGRFPTANACISDIVSLASEREKYQPTPFNPLCHKRQFVQNYRSVFSIRVRYRDYFGITRHCGEICAKHDVPIRSMLQNPANTPGDDSDAAFVLVTRTVPLANVEQVAAELEASDLCCGHVFFMPVLREFSEATS